MINCVSLGKTPWFPPKKLAELGVKVSIGRKFWKEKPEEEENEHRLKRLIACHLPQRRW